MVVLAAASDTQARDGMEHNGASPVLQAMRKGIMRTRVWVKYGDERLTISQAAARAGIPAITLRWRLQHGVPKAALFMKSRRALNREQPKPEQPSVRVVVTPFERALNGDVTADEYLMLENERDRH